MISVSSQNNGGRKKLSVKKIKTMVSYLIKSFFYMDPSDRYIFSHFSEIMALLLRRCGISEKSQRVRNEKELMQSGNYVNNYFHSLNCF